MISFALSVENAHAVSYALRQVRDGIVPTMLRTIRRGVWVHAIPNVRKRIASDSAIGRRIWGAKPAGLEKQKLVKQGKLLLGEKGGETTLLLRGIPAMLEEGARIKPHTIKRGFGRRRNPIPHPGMMLRGHHAGAEELKKAERAIGDDVNVAVGRMLGRHGF